MPKELIHIYISGDIVPVTIHEIRAVVFSVSLKEDVVSIKSPHDHAKCGQIIIFRRLLVAIVL